MINKFIHNKLKSRLRNSFFGLLLLVFITSCKHSLNEKVYLELYVAPRVYSCNLYIDNGIFNYDLEKRSISLSKEECCFNDGEIRNMNSNDSIITMFYNRITKDKIWFDKMFTCIDPIKDVTHYTRRPRALVIMHLNTKVDSIFIYQEKIWAYKGHSYKMNKILDSFFVNSLPLQLKHNWQ